MQAVLVHFEKSTVEALKAERQRTGCSVSEFIRRAVQHQLDYHVPPAEFRAHLRETYGCKATEPKP